MRDGQRRIAQANDNFNVTPRFQQSGIDRCNSPTGQGQVRDVWDGYRWFRRQSQRGEPYEKGEKNELTHMSSAIWLCLN